MSTVKEVSPRNDGLLTGCLSRFDYADAFCLPLSDEQAGSIDELARMAFAHVPGWTVALMRLRNALVRPLGLKVSYDPTANSREGELEPGSQVGIFRVYARRPQEVLMGDDDRHLDFRVSVRIDGSAGARRAIVTTVVQFKSWLGRLYFVSVRPFHRVIVPAVLKRSLGQRRR